MWGYGVGPLRPPLFSIKRPIYWPLKHALDCLALGGVGDHFPHKSVYTEPPRVVKWLHESRNHNQQKSISRSRQ